MLNPFQHFQEMLQRSYWTQRPSLEAFLRDVSELEQLWLTDERYAMIGQSDLVDMFATMMASTDYMQDHVFKMIENVARMYVQRSQNENVELALVQIFSFLVGGIAAEHPNDAYRMRSLQLFLNLCTPASENGIIVDHGFRFGRFKDATWSNAPIRLLEMLVAVARVFFRVHSVCHNEYETFVLLGKVCKARAVTCSLVADICRIVHDLLYNETERTYASFAASGLLQNVCAHTLMDGCERIECVLGFLDILYLLTEIPLIGADRAITADDIEGLSMCLESDAHPIVLEAGCRTTAKLIDAGCSEVFAEIIEQALINQMILLTMNLKEGIAHDAVVGTNTFITRCTHLQMQTVVLNDVINPLNVVIKLQHPNGLMCALNFVAKIINAYQARRTTAVQSKVLATDLYMSVEACRHHVSPQVADLANMVFTNMPVVAEYIGE